MTSRPYRTLLIAAGLLLTAAPAALADVDNGEGLAGETTDKMVTFFSLGVTIFFVAFVAVMSAIQSLLERRKAAKKAGALGPRGW